VLFVPGGFGTAAAMADAEILSFLANRAPRAKYVTSVCSGSLILGAAGLLKGYKATSHWALRDALSLFGAEPVEGRVVTDRNRITGGGVTAGIDFGLVMLAKMRGDDAARLTQLTMEYDPAPPFNAGSPAGAGPDLVKQALSFMGAADPGMAQLADGARNPT
jgi:cyclohexyl-isocyanide hydratase